MNVTNSNCVYSFLVLNVLIECIQSSALTFSEDQSCSNSTVNLEEHKVLHKQKHTIRKNFIYKTKHSNKWIIFNGEVLYLRLSSPDDFTKLQYDLDRFSNWFNSLDLSLI
ncbi:tudor domain-containing protein 5-like [Aphis craccivora]|uniref:Tudor domain-containing protein 5-like n=1 Tax=Aphis craccivora TaxID=307492 RepID=A0A6G0YIJ7_APHCR|nr:tudor domain-containing protein 5-like [Aphis craccivora]